MNKLEILDAIADYLRSIGLNATYDGDNDSGEVIVDSDNGTLVITAKVEVE